MAESYEALTARLMEAERKYHADFRAWLRKNHVVVESGDHEAGLRAQYHVEDECRVTELEALRIAYSVARAELERRNIEALERAAAAQGSSADAQQRSARFYSRWEAEEEASTSRKDG